EPPAVSTPVDIDRALSMPAMCPMGHMGDTESAPIPGPGVDKSEQTPYTVFRNLSSTKETHNGHHSRMAEWGGTSRSQGLERQTSRSSARAGGGISRSQGREHQTPRTAARAGGG